RRDLWDLLYQLAASDVTLLVTTHYMDEAERCSEIGYLYQSRLLVSGRPDELKRLDDVTPPGTRRWELVASDAAEALQTLRKMDGVLDATFFGQTIHVLAREDVSPEKLTSQVSLQTSDGIRPVDPSLEDVFVSLTRNATKASGDPTKGPPQSHPGSEVETKPIDLPNQGAKANEEPVPTAVPTPAAPSSGSIPKSRIDRATFGFLAIFLKEFAHIRRQPTTLFFVFAVPMLQLLVFGYAIDTQIEHIPLVVLDLDGRQPARELREAFGNTGTFDVVGRVTDFQSFRATLTSGSAKAGLIIPPDYTERLLSGEQAHVQVLIDGSDSQVATTALSTANLLGENLALARGRLFIEALPRSPSTDEWGKPALPIEVRPRLLYNPNLESERFFVPGLVGIILQLVTLFLTSFSIVRERELGTLEQLFVTPVGRAGLLIGKLLPYSVLAFVEILAVMVVMVYLFGVPIRGRLDVLLSLSLLFLLCGLGLGLLVSTLAKTQFAAIQFAFIIMLPSV
ncbi:MAG: ABC transporter permease, partial [Planctomycetaceae bacterium]|nr:ABC transporter permease [Planctomycetaceae bacterium]